MTLSSADIQQVIIDEVGDTQDQILASRIAVYWESFADKAAIHPRLQEWYTTKRCIDAVLGKLRNQVSFSTDGALSLQLSKRIDYLTERKKETQAEIDKLERIARSNRPPAIGQLVNVELETPPPLNPTLSSPPDANDEVFRGSPYFANTGTGGL